MKCTQGPGPLPSRRATRFQRGWVSLSPGVPSRAQKLDGEATRAEAPRDELADRPVVLAGRVDGRDAHERLGERDEIVAPRRQFRSQPVRQIRQERPPDVETHGHVRAAACPVMAACGREAGAAMVHRGNANRELRNKMKARIAAGTLVASLLGITAAAAQEHVFKLHHFLSETSPSHAEVIAPWAERVEAASGGKVAIEIYPSMTLGGRPPELVGQARDGVVDLIWVVNGYTPGLFPRTEVFELPGVYVNEPSATNLAMRDMFEDALAQEYAGLEVMFLHVHNGNGLQMVDREVRAPEDLAGLSLRTPSRTGAWVIEALGAVPVAMPVPDLPQALARKVVDGALIPWEISGPLRLAEQTDFQIEGADRQRFGNTTFQMSMNKARWDALPEDVQEAFREASGPDWLQEVGEIWRAADDRVLAEMVAAGNTHVVLTPEETAAMDAALAPVVDRWIADMDGQGIDGAALVDRARAAIAENAAE